MFTGIIETVGEIVEIQSEDSNKHFLVKSKISNELSVDQSVAHEGVCLTVTKIDKRGHWVTAIDETLLKSNVAQWEMGTRVNLERCMKANGRLDGHIVQGHVDEVAKVLQIEEKEGSWFFTFKVESTKLIVEKGSVCLNGTSLTCFSVSQHAFSVAIIPYTFENTTFSSLSEGSSVNIEFDILGKYVQKMISG